MKHSRKGKLWSRKYGCPEEETDNDHFHLMAIFALLRETVDRGKKSTDSPRIVQCTGHELSTRKLSSAIKLNGLKQY